MRNLAPIILFAYHRPDHLLKTLTALKQNELFGESDLHIYCDGPKATASATDLENIRAVREIVGSGNWGNNLKIIYRDENFGLQKSVITGVTEIADRYGKVIVLEDDIITSPFFLRFMNDALDTYQRDDKVLSIGACNFFATTDDVPETFFIPIPDCWGWATWKDRWDLFEPNAQTLLTKLRERGLINDLNLGGRYNFESMLIDQIRGNVSSWAIRWQALAYLTGKLALYPRSSVTRNIGFDAGATHRGTDTFTARLRFADKPIVVERAEITVLPNVMRKMVDGYGTINVPSQKQRAKTALKKAVRGFVPPIAKTIISSFKPKIASSWWQGNYASWTEAEADSSGYQDETILQKTLKAVLKVKNGEAAYERDTVLFDQAYYTWPLLAMLLRSAAENEGKLSVVDFGGSLGSTYFQNLPMLRSLKKLQWSVVEQEQYIKVGNEFVADEHLTFYPTVRDSLNDRNADILLLSCVLQYLEKPFDVLKEMLSYGFKYIVIDRISLIDDHPDRLTIQKVPPGIYGASYPSWFFNTTNFEAKLAEQYRIVERFKSDIIDSAMLDNDTRVYWQGYILERI